MSLRRLPAIARAGCVVVAVALTVGAVRFLPVIEQLRGHTRRIAVEGDRLRAETLVAMFLSRGPEVAVDGQVWEAHEYLAYLGPVVLLLAATGLFVLRRQEVWLVVLLAGAGSLMLGRWSDHSPWALLQAHVYPFREMRVPSRFAAIVSLVLVALAALAVDRMIARARQRLPPRGAEAVRRLVVGLALIGATDIIAVGVVRTPAFFSSPRPAAVRTSPRFFAGGPDLAAPIDQPRQNRGQLTCWALEEWGRGGLPALWSGDLLQAKGPGVVWAERSPSAFRVLVDSSPRPTTVVLNSRFDPGWRTDVGTLERNGPGLRLRVPAGRHEVHVRYWPRQMTTGIFLSTVGVVFALAFLRRRTRSVPLERSDAPRDS